MTEDYNEIYILHYLSSFLNGSLLFKIVWYNFDLHVSCGLYYSSVDKFFTVVYGKRKIGSKYMQLKYDVFSQMKVTIFKRSLAHT